MKDISDLHRLVYAKVYKLPGTIPIDHVTELAVNILLMAKNAGPLVGVAAVAIAADICEDVVDGVIEGNR